MHTPNGAGDLIEKMVGRVGMAGETRLIKLDEIDARRNEGLEIGADDRNQGLGHGVAIRVDLAPVDAASQCERPGNRHLYRPPGILPEPVVFRDSSQTVGSRQRLQAAEPLTLVVRRGTPVAGTTNWRQAAQVLVKAEVEIDPLHPPSEMRSSPARNWSSMASRTASRTASSRSTGPKRSGCEPTSPMNQRNGASSRSARFFSLIFPHYNFDRPHPPPGSYRKQGDQCGLPPSSSLRRPSHEPSCNLEADRSLSYTCRSLVRIADLRVGISGDASVAVEPG